MPVTRGATALASVVLLLGTAACGDSDKESEEEKEKKAATASCDGLLKPADAAAELPATLPRPDGAVFFDIEEQGVTKRYFARVEGDDFVKVRDELKSAFEAKGLKILGTDQEEVEAEFEFETTDGVEGSVQVIALCKDNLRVRWRVGPK